MFPPAARDAQWILVALVSAAAWTAAMLAAGYLNTGQVPAWPTVGSIAAVMSTAAAVLAFLGFLGLRMTFVCAHAGLVLGYAAMLWTFVTSTDGMADLGALAEFMLAGAIGLGVGVIVDVVRFFRRR